MEIDEIFRELCAINSSQIRIEFNKEVTKASAQNLGNYYIGLTKALSNDVETLNPGRYTATLLSDNKTVIISGANIDVSTTETNVIWVDDATVEGAGTPGTLAMKTDDATVLKDRTVYVQLRNIRTADGKLASAMETSFYAADNTRPAYAKEEYTLEKVDDQKIEITFTEPVNKATAKVYVNSTELANATGKVDYKVNSDGETLHNTLVLTLNDGNSPLDKYVELNKGNNELEIVGLRDFSGNATRPNNLVTNIKVAESTVEAPKFLGLEQAHDGSFYLDFDKALTTLEVTIENLKNDNSDVEYDLTSGITGPVKLTNGNYRYQLTFAAEADMASDDIYNGSNNIIRTVSIDKYAVGTKEGQLHEKAYKFIKDKVAPKVVEATADLNIIEFEFADEPFAGGIELDLSSITEKLILTTQDDRGFDVKVELDATDLGTMLVAKTGSNKVLQLTLASATYPELFSGNSLKAGIVANLPYGLVKDDHTSSTTPQYDQTSFIGATIDVKGGTNDSVPVVVTVGADAPTYDPITKTIKFKVFGEDINLATVRNQGNYKLDGNTLTSKSKIEVVEVSGVTDELQVIIKLEDNTIIREGAYEFEIANIATNSGAKMLPVNAEVTNLKDNTQPQMSSATLTAGNTVEVKFNETMSAAVTEAKDNFFVYVNGQKYDVIDVDDKTDNRTLVLTISQDIEYAGRTLQLELVNTVSNDMFVKDTAGNNAVEGTIKITVDIQD